MAKPSLGNQPNPCPSPRSGRQMKYAKTTPARHFKIPRATSVASFAGSLKLVSITPGSASPSPGASTLSACFAGSFGDRSVQRRNYFRKTTTDGFGYATHFSSNLSLSPAILTSNPPGSTTGLLSAPMNERSSRRSLNVRVRLWPGSR